MTAATRAKSPGRGDAAAPGDGKGKGKGKGAGHWVTVSYPNGGYHHIFVPGGDKEGARVAVGKHRPKDATRSRATAVQVHETGGTGKGHHVTVAHADGSYRHIYVKGADPNGAKAAVGKFTPAAAKAPPHPAEAAHHAKGKPAPYEPGLPLDVQRDHFADSEERRAAAMTGGAWSPGNEEYDVSVPKRGGAGLHKVEVKSKSYGNSRKLSVHAGALEAKTRDAHANPGDTWHTVALDTRDTSEGGGHAGSFSGHGVYYKRAVGRYALSKMHRVKDAAELKRLIHAPDHELPEAARGSMMTPAELKEFAVRAEAERAYNDERGKARKAKLKAEGKSAYRR